MRTVRTLRLEKKDPIAFASDFHLRAEDPGLIRSAISFFKSIEGRYQALFLLGDIFDIWIGPKSARASFARLVFMSLAKLSRSGTRVFFIAGNRDFLLSEDTAAPHGVEVLGESVILEAQERRLLLIHGDQLCVRDESYRRATRILRSAPIRTLVSRLPAVVSNMLANGYRDHSRRITRVKSEKTMGLCFDVVDRQFDLGVDGLVCGHVHRAQRFVSVNGRDKKDVVVLSTWNPLGTFATLTDGELLLQPFALPDNEIGEQEGAGSANRGDLGDQGNPEGRAGGAEKPN